jgi:hypothetical protein
MPEESCAFNVGQNTTHETNTSSRKILSRGPLHRLPALPVHTLFGMFIAQTLTALVIVDSPQEVKRVGVDLWGEHYLW